MRQIAKLLILLTFISCGKKTPTPGADGKPGAPGVAGAPGVGCEITTLNSIDLPPAGGALVQCATTSTVLKNGADGISPPQALSVVEVLDPCGKQTQYDEVLLRLGNGDIISSFSANANGDMTRFALLPDGSYSTTDSTNCNFTLSTAGNTRSITDLIGTKTWSF